MIDDRERPLNRVPLDEATQPSAMITGPDAAHRESDSFDAGSMATADGDDISSEIQTILAELRKVVPYDSASVQALHGNRLVIVGGVGFADLDVILGESFEIDSTASPNGEVVYRKQPMIVPDTERYRGFRRGLHVGAGIRSWLGVPLLHHDQLLGIIALDKKETGFYTAEHQRLALGFASTAAAAMARHRNPSS
jgi:GAF domain-containing protein